MMKHIFEQKVYYSDTDSYGVVWHGAYLRWLEMGRVELCEMMGHNLNDLVKQDIALPVATVNVKYKASARLEDVLVIETEISKFNGFSVTFKQVILDKVTGKKCIEAEFDAVAVSNDRKLYRRMPDSLQKAFEEALKCPELV